ncbi:MAG: hypothetical protein ACYS6K_05975 [Planctomycetota bacterium]|jgi:hypothetical protein
MAYSEKAKQLRRCQAKKKDGTPCKAWAMWGEPRQLCAAHAGRTRGPDRRATTRPHRFYYRRTIAVCTCEAYSFPHRPGGGLCRWPEEPIWISTIPAGTRGDLHGLWGKFGMAEVTSRAVIYV